MSRLAYRSPVDGKIVEAHAPQISAPHTATRFGRSVITQCHSPSFGRSCLSAPHERISSETEQPRVTNPAVLAGESRRVLRSSEFFYTAEYSCQRVIGATVGIHEDEPSHFLSRPPGSRSRHLGSVSGMSRSVAHCPDLLANRSGESANIF